MSSTRSGAGGWSLQDAVAAVPVIAILRSTTADRFADVADTLVEAGVRAAEFSLTTPGALDAIRRYAARAGHGRTLAIGAGTVLDPGQARAAVDAGAQFLISPVLWPETLAEAARLGVPMLPGASTPTEILTAWRSGAAMVKVFPATGGPAYLKAVREPLPDIPLVPTGGVTVADAPAFMRAGATALGMGGSLLGDALVTGDLGALHARAVSLVASLGRAAGPTG